MHTKNIQISLLKVHKILCLKHNITFSVLKVQKLLCLKQNIKSENAVNSNFSTSRTCSKCYKNIFVEMCRDFDTKS